MDEKPNKTDLPEGMNADSPAPPGPPAGEEDFARMFAASIEATAEGQVIHGRVIKVLKEYLAVDINKKSEGMLPLEDLTEEERNTLQPGDPIEVMTEGYDQAQGFIRLSRSKVVKIRVWDDLQKAFDDGVAVQGTIVAKVKGGYTVDIGVKAFLPGSQVDLRPVRDNDPVIGIRESSRSSSSPARRRTWWSPAGPTWRRSGTSCARGCWITSRRGTSSRRG